MIDLIDTHQHLILRNQASYAWTANIPALAEGDFDLEGYRSLTKDGGVAGTLFMEVAVNDDEYQKEVRYIVKLSQEPLNLIKGIIASCRPETDEGYSAWLDECEGLNVVGYRRICHTMDDSLSQTETFRKNVRMIGDRNKTFDMCFLARQLPLALELAQSCDNTTMILNHCGVPDIAGKELTQWSKDITALAGLPNVNCKISGILAYCGERQATLETIKPYINHVLEAFGPDRIVWGSDWPVVNLGGGLPNWLEITRMILEELSANEAEKIANGNAKRIYAF